MNRHLPVVSVCDNARMMQTMYDVTAVQLVRSNRLFRFGWRRCACVVPPRLGDLYCACDHVNSLLSIAPAHSSHALPISLPSDKRSTNERRQSCFSVKPCRPLRSVGPPTSRNKEGGGCGSCILYSFHGSDWQCGSDPTIVREANLAQTPIRVWYSLSFSVLTKARAKEVQECSGFVHITTRRAMS